MYWEAAASQPVAGAAQQERQGRHPHQKQDAGGHGRLPQRVVEETRRVGNMMLETVQR
jgi:hypothetical protein